MNNILKILFVFVFCVGIASCSGSDDTAATPLRDYATQYAADLDSIDEFIDTHYLTYDADYNVVFKDLEIGHSSIRTDTAFELKDTTVSEDGINYKIYFIKFREGDAVNGKRPTQVDSVHIAYRGVRLTNDQFDGATNPVWFGLQDVITGWSHIIPNFKTGTYITTSGPNPITFNDFGAGIMFLPSGLAYYNNSAGSIPSYSPIIFSFKLYELRYRDHDRDGILSKDERWLSSNASSDPLDLLSPNNVKFRWRENPFLGYDFDGDGDVEIYDTDGDGIPNMLDIDDDGDGYQTKFERRYVVGTNTYYYPFNGAAVDNLATSDVNETQGIPRKFTGTIINGLPQPMPNDFTDPTRLRRHLDPTCKPPYN